MRGYPGARRSSSGFFFIIYLIFGVYFINYAFKFVPIPAVVTSVDKWIILVGGILIIIGAINLLRLNRYSGY